MYNRQRAKDIAYAESKIPKDKLKWILNNNKLKCQAPDIVSFDRLKEICENSLSFVQNGEDALIYSPTAGNGKTTWACKIAISYINQFVNNQQDNVKGCPIPMVTFINVPEFFIQKKMAIKDSALAIKMNSIENRLKKSPLVIWDDIAYKGSTEYEDGLLYTLLNDRIEANKSNIYTTNVSIEKLDEYVSGTVASRITRANQFGNCIGLVGQGMRGYNSNDYN